MLPSKLTHYRTTAVGNILNLHEITVRKYADTGILECVTTPRRGGGAWRWFEKGYIHSIKKKIKYIKGKDKSTKI